MDDRLINYDPVRTKSDEEALKQGYVWKPENAERVISFIETFCRLYLGRWAGQTIKLMPYQFDFIAQLYGWVDPDTNFRRFREGYLEAGKKNGKSPLIASLALYHLIADKENAPEVVINATSREQATIVYKNVVQMIEQEPKFDNFFHLVDSQKRILFPDKNGMLLAASADAPSKQGLQTSLTIFDELGCQPDRKLWDAFEYSGRSREQPLKLSITNAGEPDPNHPCYAQHKRAIGVEEGSRVDVRFLGKVYGPRDAAADINDPKVWRMANPAIGYIIKESDIAEDLEKAKAEGPAALQNFKRYTLSIWEKQDNKWIDIALWNDQPKSRTDEEIAESGDIWCAGLDMSNGGDLCAYVRAAGNPKDGIDIRAYFWIPAETALRREKQENLPYREWENKYVNFIHGPIVDPLQIRDFIIEDSKKLNGKLKRLYSDEWNSHEIAHGLRSAGIDHQFMVHGYKSFHPPIKNIESMLVRKVLRHDENPLMTTNMANALVNDDNPNRNKRLVKPRDNARIDGCVGLVQAVAGLCDLLGYDGTSGENASQVKSTGKIIFIR